MNSMNHLSKSLAITVLVLSAAVSAPQASAAIRMNANAGGVCKAAAGPGANVFYFDSQLVQNTSSSVQYLTCLIPEMNPISTRSATDIQVVFKNPTGASISFTCVVQAGYAPSTVNNAVYVTPVPAGGIAQINSTGTSTPAIPARASSYSPYTLSCAIPAQGQIGIISTAIPESLNP